MVHIRRTKNLMNRAFFALLLTSCSMPLRIEGKDPTPVDHPGGDEAEARVPLEFGPAAFARLTTGQYRNLLDDVLGSVDEIALQDDTNPYLFSTIGAATDPLSEQGIELLEQGVNALTVDIFADTGRREGLVGCVPESPSDACATAFVERFGLRVLRRPLTETDLTLWLAVSEELGAGDPWQGLQAATAGLLQSPSALYRVELGVEDLDRPGELVLTDFEIATRMSLLLWNRTPDEVLLAAAEAGELATAEGRRGHARRMLEDPHAREAIEAFFTEYLDLGRLDRAAPDPVVFPGFTEPLRAAMRSEVLLLVDDLVNRRDSDVRKLFFEKRAYVNSTLATHYGLSTEGLSAVSYAPVDLPEDGQRAGILGLGAFLTMNAHAVDTSPTLRGKYILERVLCSTIPPPPDNVILDLTSDAETAATLRERLDQHRADPNCSACHALMDPPGFLFEHFDPTGAWRDDEDGHPIDSSGSLEGVDMANAGELGQVLAESTRLGPCMVRQLYRHAHARVDTDADVPTLAELSTSFAASGHRFRALLEEMVAHESFVRIGAEEAAR